MMTVEAAITIEATVAAGVFSHIAIHNHRLLAVGRLLRDQPAESAPERLSQLFSVCRVAQGVAAAEALEDAAGLSASPPQRAARAILLSVETLLDHAGRVCLDWPEWMGEEPALAPLKALRRTLAELRLDLYPDGDWLRPGGGRLRPVAARLSERLTAAQAVLRQQILGELIDCVDEPGSWPHWLARSATPAARLLRWLAVDGLQTADDDAPPLLPALDPADLRHQFAGAGGDIFAARPEWLGSPRETGALARRAGHPLLRGLLADGRGALGRLAAQLVEMALAVGEIRDFLPELCQDDGTALSVADAVGVGMVEAARGRLIHGVGVRDGQIGPYRIVAPTEWNFHPHGALFRALQGRPVIGDAKRMVQLQVLALDPCVPCDVRVS